MKYFLILILLFSIAKYTLEDNQIWNFGNSAIDLLTSDSSKYIIYDQTKKGIHIKLEKYITKESNRVIDKNYIQINNDERKEVEWEDINDFYPIKGGIYICPKGKNFLSFYSKNIIETKIIPDNGVGEKWDLTCYYYKNRIFISYLGANDNKIYSFNVDNKKYEILEKTNGCYDIFWPEKEINEDTFFAYILLDNQNNINIAKLIIEVNETTNSSIKENTYVNHLENKRIVFFGEDISKFYSVSYEEYKDHYESGIYSIFLKSNDDIENINKEVRDSQQSPFKGIENMKINFVEIIRNTKYAYYKVSSNEKFYYGIIDIESNEIIFNTNDFIFKLIPFSKHSLFAITSLSAYEICIYGIFKGKCIDKCPPGQTLKKDESGNHCDGNEICNNYIFKPNNTCIDSCDEDIYTLIEEKECGLCKYLNKTFPYKVKGQKLCQEKIPDQNNMFDESTYIIIVCDSSCETCYGEKENQCLTCKNSILFEGKCINNCPESFYKDKKENICLKCNTNCKTCNEGSEEGNDHCTSCQDELFLINAKGMARNCVEECPNNTISNNITMECNGIKNENPKKNENKLKNFINRWIWIILIIILLLILSVIVIIICVKKYIHNRKKENINLILQSDDDNFNIQPNESGSQGSED